MTDCGSEGMKKIPHTANPMDVQGILLGVHFKDSHVMFNPYNQCPQLP